jgi:hypothetical protein
MSEVRLKGEIELKIEKMDETCVYFEASFVHDGQRIPLQNHGLRCLHKGGTLTIYNVETTLIMNSAFLKDISNA